PLARGASLVGALIHLAQIQGDARAPIGLELHRVTGDPLDIAVDSKALLAVARGRADREAEQKAEDPNSHPRLCKSCDHISAYPSQAVLTTPRNVWADSPRELHGRPTGLRSWHPPPKGSETPPLATVAEQLTDP